METITVTIPADWLKGHHLNQDELRQVLELGLNQLHLQQQSTQEQVEKTIETLLRTGRIRRLTELPGEVETPFVERQPPPILSGPPLSDILIAQRRGEG